MSPVTRNFMVCYLCLVVLPVVSLVGILKTGSRLKAPILVEGVWDLQSPAEGVAALLCRQSVPNSQTVSIAISQSGRYLTLSVKPEITAGARGLVEGTLIQASLSPHAQVSNQSGCAPDRRLTLTAAISANEGSMTGALSVDDCSSCKPVEFRALRRPAPEPKRAN